MSTDNQKYVKTLAKVCRKKGIETALKSMSKTSSMSRHTEYVKSSPIFLMRDPRGPDNTCPAYRTPRVDMAGHVETRGMSR